jgi:hypothetical protein
MLYVQNKMNANIIPPSTRPWMTLLLSEGDLRPPQAIDTTVWFEPNSEAAPTNRNVRRVSVAAKASNACLCQTNRGIKERNDVNVRAAAILGADGIFIFLLPLSATVD